MSATDDPASAEPTSDNEKLIAALQICFHDLVQKQEEQFKAQQEHSEKLHKALEALKPPVPDKKTAFWNAYMKLANEHDKEFKEKYGTDLDTALIFAGLFSAVSSAFIIQIQSQVMAPPEPLRIIVVAQSLLYISLFTTLLAALLAVLGKQWIMHYEAAGSRGSIEERGLERQRKLDGMRRWKFDAVLQMFPLLLQLALLLFSTALSLYLWTVHHTIAIIVQALTLLGCVSYIFLLLSAILSPDSPFQTPLAPILLHIFSPTLRIVQTSITKLGNLRKALWARFMKTKTVLPSVALHAMTPGPLASSTLDPDQYFPPSSPEVPAVLWVLETSTDPVMISITSELAAELQWPLELDPTVPMALLSRSYSSCLEFSSNGKEISGKIRKGMTHLASSYARAYCAFGVIARASSIQRNEPGIFGSFDGEYVEPETSDAADWFPISTLEFNRHCMLFLHSSHITPPTHSKAFKYFLHNFCEWTKQRASINRASPITSVA
ncbi:hypothetical protein FB451DRAFT_164118 [Mycena latifolia]|nr:hypothetical protein FB451DRAFT_164118 [Mycena latifolia]